jgi:transporter family protein
MWKYYAILSAIFASLTAIFAKIGIKNVDSNLATAIRTCIIFLITWGIVFVSNRVGGIKELTKINWVFLVLSGVATGLSWLFYFKALQLGDASKVAPIDKLSVVFTIFISFVILKETVSWKVILGGLLIAGGSLVILMDEQ